MKVSRAVGYGLRALAYLARNGTGRKVTIGEIADAEEIPAAYLFRVLKSLSVAGMVAIYRGSQGGYALLKDPRKITMLDVYEAIEGRLALRDCVDNPSTCSRSKKCPARPIWRDLQERVRRAFDASPLTAVTGAL